MNNRLSHAIVVGGSRGIGFAIAKKFLKNSLNVTIVSRNEDNLIKNSMILKNYVKDNKLASTIYYHVCDITKENDIIDTCQKIINYCDRQNEFIKILVNSAGITLNKLLVASKTEDIYKVIDTNLVGTMLFTKMLYKQMIKQNRGSIINIGSIVGLNGNIGQTIYSSSKASLIGFTKSLAKELGSKNITVNLIVPGFIETDMIKSSKVSKEQLAKYKDLIPLKRIGRAEEIADAAYFLGNSTFITGSVLVVDGGLSLNL